MKQNPVWRARHPTAVYKGDVLVYSIEHDANAPDGLKRTVYDAELWAEYQGGQWVHDPTKRYRIVFGQPLQGGLFWTDGTHRVVAPATWGS